MPGIIANFRLLWRKKPTEIPTLPYKEAANEFMEPFLEAWGQKLVIYAKETAPWNDRTGAARGGIHYQVHKVEGSKSIPGLSTDGSTTTIELKSPGNDAWSLLLGYSVPYGLWLEVRWGGRYAVLLPTMEIHQQSLMREFRERVGHG